MANEERINKIIDELTLFDDDLMSRVFDKNIEATEYVLQIILGRKTYGGKCQGTGKFQKSSYKRKKYYLRCACRGRRRTGN